MRPGIVRINFAEVRHINYNATIYRDFDIFALLYIESIATILDMVLAYKGGKLSTIPYKVFLYFFLVLIKLERKHLKPVNSLRPLELSDS